MLKRNLDKVIKKNETRAEKDAKSLDAVEEKKLRATFNAVAKLEKYLTDMHEKNPKFDFDIEKNERGAYIVTNIPLWTWGGVDPKTKDLEINVKDGRIVLTVDPHDEFMGSCTATSRDYAAFRVKKAAKVVAQHIGKRGLGS